MKNNTLTIATRESPLALWQANWVKDRLKSFYPQLSIELLGMTTSADKMLETPLYKVGGKGLFVKELEEALLDQRADIAVHSMKDVPMVLPEGLCVPVMCEREDPHDAFVSNQFKSLRDLPEGAIVGTSSLRRQSQLLAMYPKLQIAFLRGNVNTRLAKLDQGDYDAVILAAAGLKRLGFGGRIKSLLAEDEMLPAAGQGVLGIECRSSDHETQTLISVLNHANTFACVTAERAMCRFLGGSCQVPIGAYAILQQQNIRLRGLVGHPRGEKTVHTEQSDKFDHAEALGIAAAEDLLKQGARDLLNG